TGSGNVSVLWLRIKPNTPLLREGVMTFDHTTRGGEGNYLALSNELRNYHSTLRSPIILRKSRSICFSMYYFASSDNRSSLSALRFSVRSLDGSKTLANTDVNASYHRMGWTGFQLQIDN